MESSEDKQASAASTNSSSSGDGNITTTKRTDRSKFMKLLQSTAKPVMNRIPPPKKEYPEGSPQLDPHKSVLKHCDVRERVVEEIYVYDLNLKDSVSHANGPAAKRTHKQLYYFAGGSWREPPSRHHWAFCAELANQLPPDTRVSVVSTPLAPKSPAPKAFPQLLAMYRQLLIDAAADSVEVILAGDSSGAEQILCLTGIGIAEDSNAPAPVALVAICPSVDLRQTNLEQLEIEGDDPILRIESSRDHAEKWRGSWTAVDSRINPLYIDWELVAKKGVKIHGVVGGIDILRPDAIKLREKLDRAGIKGEWLDWENQMHGFPLTFNFGLSEGKEAKNWVVEVIEKT